MRRNSTAMNSSKIRIVVSVMSLAFVIATVRGVQAQTDTTQSTSADMSVKIENLEKQISDLRSQLDELKKSAATPAAAAAAPPAPAQAAVASPAPDASQSSKVTLASLLGPTSLSGFVDMYYDYNFNQPASRANTLRSFDIDSNQFALNMVELVLDKAPDAQASRTGYHVALGYGQAMNAVNGSDPGGLGFDQYLKEAYFSYLAPMGKGLQFDFGKFVTPNGAEVIETKDNWNYSRGLLFSYAIPYYHFGLRTKYAFNDKYSLTGYLVNGWNNVVDNNTGKTYGLSFGWNPNKKWGFTENFMAGPEQANNNSNWRQLWDTVATYTPNGKLSLMANYDYARGDRVKGIINPVYWSGIAGYIRYTLNSKYNVAARYEYYDDHDGFTTGTAGHIHEFTGTLQRTIAGHFLTNLELRRDFSNNPIFTKGAATPVTAQTTATAGLVFTFDTREPN